MADWGTSWWGGEAGSVHERQERRRGRREREEGMKEDRQREREGGRRVKEGNLGAGRDRNSAHLRVILLLHLSTATLGRASWLTGCLLLLAERLVEELLSISCDGFARRALLLRRFSGVLDNRRLFTPFHLSIWRQTATAAHAQDEHGPLVRYPKSSPAS